MTGGRITTDYDGKQASGRAAHDSTNGRLGRFDSWVESLCRSRERQWAVAALIGLVLYVLYHTLKFRLETLADPTAVVDFTIMYSHSRWIVATGHYPNLATGQFFPYAPPMVVLFSWFGIVDLAVARAVWVLMKAAALLIVLLGGLKLIGADRRPERWLIVIAAVISADPAVHWDLRTHNNVLIYLALIVGALLAARGRPWLAGGLLAMSATLKLYSGLFLPWLLWRGCFRWLWASSVFLALFWIALPLAWFRPSGALLLYREWLGQIAHASTAIFYAAPAPLISLRHGLAGLFGLEPFGTAMGLALWSVRFGWLALLAGYVLVRHRRGPIGAIVTPSDAVVLMLAPLPFSPILQPTHGAPLLLGAIILIGAALDARHPPRLRVALALAATIGFVLGKIFPDFAVRGAVTFAIYAVQIAGLLLLQLAMSRPTELDRPVRSAAG